MSFNQYTSNFPQRLLFSVQIYSLYECISISRVQSTFFGNIKFKQYNTKKYVITYENIYNINFNITLVEYFTFQLRPMVMTCSKTHEIVIYGEVIM